MLSDSSSSIEPSLPPPEPSVDAPRGPVRRPSAPSTPKRPLAGGGAPVRIAHVQLLPLLSGVQRVTVDELTRLDRRRFEPYVICQSPGPLSDALEKEHIRCLFAPSLTRPISPWRDVAAFWELRRLMRRYAFDIVHTHSSKPGVLGRIAARLAGVPVVLHTVHGFAFPATRSKAKRAVYAWSERLAGRFCDGVICVKNSDGASAVGLLGLPTERVHVFPNAVDTRRFQPLDSAARADVRSKVFGVARSTAVVGMVGRLAEQKNPLCFVRTAHAVLQRGLDAAFFLIGDGELRGNVEAEIARLGCTGRITVLGWRPDVPELLGALDLFVLPSRWEGLSLAILEAMACGVPVVASDIPGNRDAVVEGVDGWLAAPDNPASTAAAAVALLESESMRKEFGAAARQKIECEFNWDTRHLRITRLYESLLAGKFEP